MPLVKAQNEYLPPDFDVTTFDLSEVITTSDVVVGSVDDESRDAIISWT